MRRQSKIIMRLFATRLQHGRSIYLVEYRAETGLEVTQLSVKVSPLSGAERTLRKAAVVKLKGVSE